MVSGEIFCLLMKSEQAVLPNPCLEEEEEEEEEEEDDDDDDDDDEFGL
jgi:hypothetical protein